MPVEEGTLAPGSKPFSQSRFTSINGVKIHYCEWQPVDKACIGNIMLIHGFSGSSYSWRKNIDALVQAGYHVVAPDVPPFGYSGKDEGVNHSASANALLLWELAHQLAPNSSWALMGHSMGASVAGAMAAVHPREVKKVILVDGPFTRSKKTEEFNFTGKLVACGPVKRLAEVVAKINFYNYAKFNDLLTSAYGCRPDSEDVVNYLAPFKIKGMASAILEMGKYGEVLELNPDSIASPVLVVWGKEDAWIPLETGKKFMKQFPRFEMRIFENAGHCPMETKSDSFNRTVLDFLKR